ncbi:MAG: type II secretion system protein GspG [Thermodesulfovibrionia bacterium]|nr:type II secretion system protein GspG [Thermodesulfovibrionia bacterium]
MRKRSGNQGFTLIEVIVVAGIIAILAGVLVPMILKEIDETRITRASADIRSISNAILIFKKDTAQWPVMDGTCSPNLTLLTGGGNAPDGIGANGWDNTASAMIDSHLMYDDDGCYNNWNGSYLPVTSADPWGKQYVINTGNFGVSGSPVWIMSAGPNGTLDSNANSTSSGGDDIGLRIK